MFCYTSQLKTRKKQRKNDLFLNTTVAVPAVRTAVKPSCPTETTREQYFSSQLTKNKDNAKVALPFLMLNSRIVFELTRNSIFCCKYNYFPAWRQPDQRATCRTRAAHFFRQIKRLKTQNVQIFPFVNLICFCSYKSLFLNNECLL